MTLANDRPEPGILEAIEEMARFHQNSAQGVIRKAESIPYEDRYVEIARKKLERAESVLEWVNDAHRSRYAEAELEEGSDWIIVLLYQEYSRCVRGTRWYGNPEDSKSTRQSFTDWLEQRHFPRRLSLADYEQAAMPALRECLREAHARFKARYFSDL